MKHQRNFVLAVASAYALFAAGCALEEQAPAGEGEGDVIETMAPDESIGTSASASTAGDFCYGAHGAHCDGVPTSSTLAPISLGGNLVSVPVSVGSQFHDQCCARVRATGGRGYMCNGGNTDTGTCKPEWDRAANDQLWGYVWRATFDRTVFRPYSTSAPLAGLRAPSRTKISVNDARGGWCAAGFYLINFGMQAVCN
jgi:hypothetical protein